ncbi:hypothetical protein ACWD4T_05475 [Streptomyces umbrinus]
MHQGVERRDHHIDVLDQKSQVRIPDRGRPPGVVFVAPQLAMTDAGQDAGERDTHGQQEHEERNPPPVARRPVGGSASGRTG